jgi:PAS domain S-box-containing protein
MSYIVHIIVLISTLTLWTPALAQGVDAGGPAPVILREDQVRYALGQHMETLEDPGGTLTIQDVSSPGYSDQFVPSHKESPTFGYTSSVYWVRFRLNNQSQLSNHWLLEVNFANTQHVDLYIPTPDGEGYILRRTGVLEPFNTRDIANHHIVFNLPLEYQQDQTYYMRFQSAASMTLPLTVWFPEAFFQTATTEQLLLGLFYGMFLIMLVYNLFLFFSLRERTYLYFACFLASGILVWTAYDALTTQYLWPNWPPPNLYAMPVFAICILASIILFTDAFLETGIRSPKVHQLLMLVVAGWGICLLLVLFVSYHIIMNIIAPYGVISLVIVAIVGLSSWRRGYKPARFFLLAWIGLLIGGSLLFLVRLGFIPSTPFTEQSFRPAVIWLMAFWAIALADRINVLKEEKEKANRETRASEARFHELVETMNEGVGVIDENGQYTYVNGSLAEFLGHPANEVVGHVATEFVSEENKEILTGQFARRREGDISPYELTLPRKDGRDRFVLVRSVPVFEADRQFNGSIAVIMDITERVEAGRLLEQRVAERTRELQDARTQISTLFNNTPLGIIMVTTDGRILGINQAIQRITGYAEDEFLQMNITALYASPEQREFVMGQLEHKGFLSNYGVQLRRRDGSLFYASLNLSRLVMNGEEVALGIVDDVTEQVEARQAMALLHQMSFDLISITDLQLLITQVVPRLSKVLDFQYAALMLVEAGEGSLTIYAYSSTTLQPELMVQHVPIESWPSLQAVLNGRETTYVPDLQASEVIQAELDGIKMKEWAAALKSGRSWLSVPMLAGERTIGLLNLFHPQAGYYEAADIELASTFANQLAVAIENIHLNELSRRAAAAGERSRIARDLHDSVTQTLFSASVLAEAIPRTWNKNQDTGRKNLEKLSRLIRGALAEMRSLLVELRSEEKPGQNLSQLLSTLAEGARARSNMAVVVNIEGDQEPPADVSLTIYRITQEALNNVIKHAIARRLDIALLKEPLQVILSIKDDGRGFDPDAIPAGHLGISIMAERARKIGGDFQILSEPGRGTEIRVTWTNSGKGTNHD